MSGGNVTSEFWREHDAELLDLAADGKTTTEAAAALGVSKNAIIGRARRIGIVWALWPNGVPQPNAKARPPAIEFPRAGHCVFPIGDPNKPHFRFCGERVAEIGQPYCHEHRAVCYRVQARQEAAE